MNRLLSLAAVLAVTSCGAGSAPAFAQEAPAPQQQVCKKRSELIEVLAKKFGETQQSFGLQNDTRVLEIYASASGSWTAILTLPNGKSCVVAAGQAWTTLPPAPVGDPV
jgi:hypothetical protein